MEDTGSFKEIYEIALIMIGIVKQKSLKQFFTHTSSQ